MMPPSHDVRSVLMTADAVGGVWSYAMELCGGLARRSVRVTLAVLGPSPSDAQREEARSIPGLALREPRLSFALEWMDEPWLSVELSGAWLLELERETRPDVIHLNGYAHGALPFLAPVVVVGHSCVVSWFDQVKGEPAPPRYDAYRRRVTRGLQTAAEVVAPSATMLRFLEQHYGALPHARVIRNGRSAAAFEQLAGARKEPFVAAAGRLWDEAKNLRALDEAAASIAWPVCVAGNVRHPDGRIVEARSAHLTGQLGTEQVAALFGRAGIFAAPALYEPFGLAPLEGALAGCALVLSDIPSFRELWDGCAEFVDPRDPASIAACVNRLAAEPSRRAALARRARERARAFDPARMTDEYLATYRSLVPQLGAAA